MSISSIKERLIARKSELSARLRRIESDLDSPRSPDDDDRAIEREDEEVLEELGEAGLSELRAIDAALDRIDHDRYGICTKCGNPVSKERLNAMPQAALCMACMTEING